MRCAGYKAGYSILWQASHTPLCSPLDDAGVAGQEAEAARKEHEAASKLEAAAAHEQSAAAIRVGRWVLP